MPGVSALLFVFSVVVLSILGLVICIAALWANNSSGEPPDDESGTRR